MWLPEPSDEKVEEFRMLAKEEYGLDLTAEGARKAATTLLQMHYALAYAYRDEGPADDRPDAPGNAGIRPAPEDPDYL